MADYSSPYMPNVYSNANAMSTMQGLADRQKQNQANMEASQHIANGDYASAEQAYRSAGMNDQADAAHAKGTSITAGNHIANGDYHSAADVMLKNGYYDQARKFSQDHLEDVNKLYGIGSQIAQTASPDQWQQFIDHAKKDGFDVAQFEDPATGPKLMQAYAGKLQEFNKDRLDQLKAFPPQAATQTGPNGEKTTGLGIFNPQTNKYDFTPGTPGLDVSGAAINAKAKSGKTDPVEALRDEIADKYKDKNRIPYSFAESIHNALTNKFNAGLTLQGIDFDEDGNALLPHYGAPAGTAAALRANQWDSDAQFARARAARSGIKQADADQRASFATGAINHLSMAEQHLNEPGVDKAIGAIQGNDTYQKWRGYMYPSDVQTPEEYGKIRQDLESAQAEVERLYTAGQGAVTDSERQALKGIIVAIKDAPNRETALTLVRNAKELIGGILETPTILDVQKNPTLKATRDRGMSRVEDLIRNTTSAKNDAAEGAEVPHNGKIYVKRNGEWFEK